MFCDSCAKRCQWEGAEPYLGCTSELLHPKKTAVFPLMMAFSLAAVEEGKSSGLGAGKELQFKHSHQLFFLDSWALCVLPRFLLSNEKAVLIQRGLERALKQTL